MRKGANIVNFSIFAWVGMQIGKTWAYASTTAPD